MKTVGSQKREKLADAGYELTCRPFPGGVVLKAPSGNLELWQVNNHYSGYVVVIGRWGYEFVRDYYGPITNFKEEE